MIRAGTAAIELQNRCAVTVLTQPYQRLRYLRAHPSSRVLLITTGRAGIGDLSAAPPSSVSIQIG
jgi:hypothetical protein